MSSRFTIGRSSALLGVAIGLLALMTACSKSEPEKSAAAPASVSSSASNGPAPATILRDGVTFTADPNPILTGSPKKGGVTTLNFQAPVKGVEIRVGSPSGTLFASTGGIGHAKTGPWVTDGLTFYLQDSTAPNPKDSSATLATLSVSVK